MESIYGFIIILHFERLSWFLIHIIKYAFLRIPDPYGARTTEKQTPLSHFALLFYNWEAKRSRGFAFFSVLAS